MNHEELRKEAAEKKYPISVTSFEHEKETRVIQRDDFIAGAEWEAEREKWISCDDRMPDRGVCVLVYINNGAITCAHTSIKQDAKTWELYGDMQAMFDVKYQQVTHWQPLPTPPKTSK